MAGKRFLGAPLQIVDILPGLFEDEPRPVNAQLLISRLDGIRSTASDRAKAVLFRARDGRCRINGEDTPIACCRPVAQRHDQAPSGSRQRSKVRHRSLPFRFRQVLPDATQQNQIERLAGPQGHQVR